MSQSQIAEREAECVIADAKAKRQAKHHKRQQALADRWKDPFDLLDDILERGIAPVKADRDAIKQANPKGE
jgi:hypothetical protein